MRYVFSKSSVLRRKKFGVFEMHVSFKKCVCFFGVFEKRLKMINSLQRKSRFTVFRSLALYNCCSPV